MHETNAARYYREHAAAMEPTREALPGFLKGFGGMYVAAMGEGKLDIAQKELIALAIGMALRCEDCIYTHVRGAVKAGATRDQVLEAATVAVMMSGGPGYTYLPRVTEALDALET
ncbi:carboxymuconolactone decarboxylase family protein [Candidatus Laterigemmans baculatus]|uniref:carboxymuconolactone decarboxylase family protein n=1 Tax=Candidatus Laterigemmans baculatus TaxID=2770505 RepID=UPI00193C0C95|nr:carboxymuconolactone decarboxylase family protein [Candidatus Laterigemmans baculatus]